MTEKWTKKTYGPEQPTLRDRFAMAALTGLLANDDWSRFRESCVSEAFNYADIAIADRSPTPPSEVNTELLEALKNVLAFYIDACETNYTTDPESHPDVDAARATIAKYEGGEA